MKHKTAITLSLALLFSTPHLAAAGMVSALDSLFGPATGRGEESFQVVKKKALADKDPWHAWLELSARKIIRMHWSWCSAGMTRRGLLAADPSSMSHS